MSNSRLTVAITAADGTAAVFTKNMTDGTASELTELKSSNSLGKVFAGKSLRTALVAGENQVEYVEILDQDGKVVVSLPGCNPESHQPEISTLPAVTPGHNWILQGLTAAA